MEPVHNATNILTDRYGTDKDVSFLHNMITSHLEYEYLILLRQKRHEELIEEDLNGNQIYMDLIHEALHIVNMKNLNLDGNFGPNVRILKKWMRLP